MATRSLGQLTLDLVARIGSFTGPLEKAKRTAKGDMADIAKSVKSATTAIAGAGAAATAAAAGIVAFTNRAAESAKELTNQASLANTSVEEFQRMAYATASVGVEQDKLADILKDTNDRVGDFLNTGGGEMADFFERIAPQIGMTAEQFRNVSGPQALQMFYDGLQKANLSQAEMTFYMESIADEATALIPLLRDGGAGFAEMGDEADRLGIVLSEIDIARLNEFRDQFVRLTSIMESMGNLVAAELAPYLSVLADYIVDAAEGAGGLREWLPDALRAGVEALGPLLDGFQQFQKVDAQFRVAMASMDLAVAEFAESGWESMQWFIDTAINGINNLIRGVNAIPGIDDVELFGSFAESDFLTRIQQQSIDARAELEELQQNLQEIAAQEPPSAAIGRFLDDVQTKMNEGVDLPVNIGGGGRSNTHDPDAAAAAQKALEQIQSQIDSLQLQAEMVGLTTEEQTLFKLAAEGATEAQLAQARAALETVSAYDDQQQALEDYRSLVDELRTPEERLNDTLLKRLDILEAARVSQDEYADAVARIADAGFADAPEYQGLDASVGGAFGELGKIDDARAELEEWYSDQLEMLDNYRSERADLTEQWDAQERELKEKHEAEIQRIEQARQIAQMAAAESVFGDLSDMAKTFAGEQSSIYQGLFAVQKAAAIAQSVIAIQQGIAMAAANPWPANLAAMASVASATAGLVSNISSVSLDGMAHDGIDSVPGDGTWYLQKGERVTTSETSAKLDKTLDDVQSRMVAPGESPSGVPAGGLSVSVDARGATDPAAIRRAAEQGAEMGYRRVLQDFKTNGPGRRMLKV